MRCVAVLQLNRTGMGAGLHRVHADIHPYFAKRSDARLRLFSMPSLILLMIVGAAVFTWWSAARAAAERAVEVGRTACREAGVQLLDQTVHATVIRLRRRADGRMGVERSFRFEYSRDGIERHVGRLVLRGDDLVAFSGPTRTTESIDTR